MNFGMAADQKVRETIFAKKRCFTCKKKQKTNVTISLEAAQEKWLLAAVSGYKYVLMEPDAS